MIHYGFTQKVAGFDGAIIGSTDDGQLIYSKRKMLDWLTVVKGLEKNVALAWLTHRVWSIRGSMFAPIFCSDLHEDIEEIIEMNDVEDEMNLGFNEPEDWEDLDD